MNLAFKKIGFHILVAYIVVTCSGGAMSCSVRCCSQSVLDSICLLRATEKIYYEDEFEHIIQNTLGENLKKVLPQPRYNGFIYILCSRQSGRYKGVAFLNWTKYFPSTKRCQI